MIPGLSFDEELHQYSYQGRPVLGVTSILAPLTNYDSVPAAVLSAASAFGTAVHKACELRDLRDLDEATLDAQLVPYVNAWEAFCHDHDCVWELVEQPVYHKGLRYAGTPDRIGTVRGVRSVVDLKTTAALYPSVGPQLSAYDAAFQSDPRGERLQRLGVQLKADGSYHVQPYRDPADFAVFTSLLTLRNWCAQHAVTPHF